MLENTIIAAPSIGINIMNIDLRPIIDDALDAELAVELQVRRLRLYWRKYMSIGAGLALFIWGEYL